MDILHGQLKEKEAFIYKIQKNGEEKYYYLGCSVFKECTNEEHQKFFEKYAQSIEVDDSKMIRIFYNKVMDAAKSKDNKDRESAMKIKELIYSLEFEEVEALQRQLSLFTYLYSRYSNRLLSRRYFIE